jgi:hypothetical protein
MTTLSIHLARAIVLLMVEASLLLQAPPATATLRGRVVDAVSGRPVAGAVVRLSYSPKRGYAPGRQHAPPQRSANTDGNGGFVFTAVEPGEYSVHSSSGGYLESWYGAKRPNGSLRRVIVADAPVTDIVIRLWPAASIEGRVTDETGRPVMGATVRVIASEPQVFGSATTDDRGLYRIDRLVPGAYAVAVPSDIDSRALDRSTPVRARRGSPGSRDPFLLDAEGRNIVFLRGPVPAAVAPGRLNLYVTSYFGGATLADATRIRLEPGDTRTGIDIRLQARRAVRVSGRIAGPDGSIPGVVLTLLPEGQRPDAFVQWMHAAADNAGSFSFVLAPEGRYTLTAHKRVPALTPVRLDEAGEAMVAMDDVIMQDEDDFWFEMPLVIGDADVTNLSLVMHPGTIVSGRVTTEDGGAPTPDGKAPIFFLASADGDPYGWRNLRMARVQADGTFSLKVKPGRYAAEGPSDPSGWGLKGLSLNGASIGDGPLTVGTDAVTGIEAVFSRTPTILQGVASGTDGRPAAGDTLVVFPVDRRRWIRLKDTATRGRFQLIDDAQFEVTGLLEGEYFVAAVDDSFTAGWPSPATLDRLIPLATRVTVVRGQPVRVALTVKEGAR